MEPGEKCICQCDEWFNAFGEGVTMLTMGQRLTVSETRMVGGVRFYGFEEVPQGHYFMYDGFKAMRGLN